MQLQQQATAATRQRHSTSAAAAVYSGRADRERNSGRMMGGAAGGCYCGVVVSGIALFLVHVGKAESKSITLSSLQTGLNVYNI